MIVSKDKDIEEAARSLFEFCTNEQVRKLCRDKEEYHQDLRNYAREIEKMGAVIYEEDTVITEKEEIIAQKDALIKKLLAELETLKR